MKKIQSTLLASSLIAALFFSTAYAATSNQDTNPHKMRDLVEMAQAEKAEQADDRMLPFMGGHRRTMMKRDGGPWKTLSELTGKDVATIQQECHTNHKSPYEYAKENGVEKQFQAKNLQAVKKGLNLAVANGKITQEKADAALARFIKFQKDEADGKIMRHKGPGYRMINASGAISEGRNGMDYQAQVPGPQARHMFMGLMPFDTLAELTGKNVQDLMETCRTEQKTCYDIAKENGVLDQYKEKRIAANREILAKLVADGKITQEKADRILVKVEKNINDGKPERKHMARGQMMKQGPDAMPASEN